MLKAIELSGFKSFADRTRLEFPPGVTVVVGPNGSGKSNVVDALKWVLGSQSAKSLRGKEMTDVIFNGSGSRGPLNTAEATLTIDNSSGLLDIESPDVHLTRRVYRSGEGEYLINRQPCRLRDIRDLLAGTGIATEAYSIIEQGKVDVLLQSSPRERRIIFEEAAGISRFKAKRAEAARRLERVEQNLLRLSDLVDEVESRLRSVRMQAGKARKYRDFSQRLQELRTAVGLADWHALSKQIDELSAQTEAKRELCQRQEDVISQGDSQLAQLDLEIEAAGDALKDLDSQDSADREEIALHRAAAKTGEQRRQELEQELARHRRQIAAMSTRVDNAAQQLQDAENQLSKARQELHTASSKSQETQSQLESAQAELDTWKADADRVAAQQREVAGQVAELTNELQVLASQKTSAEAARTQSRDNLQELNQQQEVQSEELRLQKERQRRLQADVDTAAKQLREAQEQVAERRRDVSRTRKKLGELASNQARLAERIDVLEELEKRREGYSSGVKEVLEQAQQAPDGPFGDVCGTVAEVIQVDIDTAPLIEIAIGERAQYLVVQSGERLLDWLQQHPHATSGRVGFLRLDVRTPASAVDRLDLSDQAGVFGRADAFVQSPPEYAELARRVLGRTWLVDSLATAVRLSKSVGRGLSFVTGEGELLAAEGTLVVGPRNATSGLLTRASELRTSRDQVCEIERQMGVQQKQLDRLEQELAEHEQAALARLTEHTGLAKDLAAASQVTDNLEQELHQTAEQMEQIEAELNHLDQEFQLVDRQVEESRTALQQARDRESELEQHRRTTMENLPTANARADELRSAATAAQVAMAKCEQRVEILESQFDQIRRDQHERTQALTEVGERLQASGHQFEAAERSVLEATQAVAMLALRRQRLSQEIRQRAATSAQLKAQRNNVAGQVQRARQKLSTLQNELNRSEVAIGKQQHERETLWERLRDDYGIDLKEAAANPSNPEQLEDRQAIDGEIADLRSKINTIGSVNLDALEELDELEERFERLSGHYRDLVDSKSSLERIIQRINLDSRKLFTATLDSVRGHFQELFRRLFGGGAADLVLEDGAEDVLESGIEIMACPPGKETRTISLLSGGEKTLTCVALLLAVFRSKPSPFCVLDEVDAALDEANIGRFTSVLGEFLSSTQFIVVTHSKKTMAGADTLYGVTMQESGVSKLVSVRFEDVTDDGHIRPGAVARSAPPESGTQRRAA